MDSDHKSRTYYIANSSSFLLAASDKAFDYVW